MYVHAEVRCLLNIKKQVFPGRLSCWYPFFSAEELRLPGNRQKDQPPANFFLPKATATILTEATFELGMVHLSLKGVAWLSYAQVIAYRTLRDMS